MLRESPIPVTMTMTTMCFNEEAKPQDLDKETSIFKVDNIDGKVHDRDPTTSSKPNSE